MMIFLLLTTSFQFFWRRIIFVHISCSHLCRRRRCICHFASCINRYPLFREAWFIWIFHTSFNFCCCSGRRWCTRIVLRIIGVWRCCICYRNNNCVTISSGRRSCCLRWWNFNSSSYTRGYKRCPPFGNCLLWRSINFLRWCLLIISSSTTRWWYQNLDCMRSTAGTCSRLGTSTINYCWSFWLILVVLMVLLLVMESCCRLWRIVVVIAIGLRIGRRLLLGKKFLAWLDGSRELLLRRCCCRLLLLLSGMVNMLHLFSSRYLWWRRKWWK